MARISTYAVSSPAKLTDELLGSDINSATKNFTVQSIIDLTGITAGTDNTLAMFGPGSTLVDSPLSITSGNVLNIETIDHINLKYNSYYDRNLKISGEDSASQGHSFDGVQVTGELIVAKENGLPGDLAVYFRSDDTKLGGMVLDDDESQYGLYFYVSSSATELNPNIVEKISLAEGTTIGVSLVSVVPPENGLQVQGNINADSDLTVRGATALNAAQATTPTAGDNSNNIATTAFVKTSIDQIPSGLQYQGSWDADKNIPDLTALIVQNAQYWIVSHDGDTELDGETDWKVGDWAIYTNNETYQGWQKIDNTSVLSGGGTSGKIPLFSGPNTLGDSIIRQIGTSGITVYDQNGNDILSTQSTKVASNVYFEAPEISTDLLYGNYGTSTGLEVRGRKSPSSPRLVLPPTGVEPAYIMGEGASFGINTTIPSYDLDIQSRGGTSDVTRVGIGATGLIKSTAENITLTTVNGNDNVRLAIAEENVISIVGSDRTVHVASIGVGNNVPLLVVNGGVKIGDSFQGNGGIINNSRNDAAEKAGTLRFFEGPNASRLQIAMKTADNPPVYSWVDIVVTNY